MNIMQALDTLRAGKRVRHRTCGEVKLAHGDDTVVWADRRGQPGIGPGTVGDMWELIEPDEEELAAEEKLSDTLYEEQKGA